MLFRRGVRGPELREMKERVVGPIREAFSCTESSGEIEGRQV